MPPPGDTQLAFDMVFITMFYTCLVTEVVFHEGGRGGGKHRIRKSVNLYIVLQRHTLVDIKIIKNVNDKIETPLKSHCVVKLPVDDR